MVEVNDVVATARALPCCYYLSGICCCPQGSSDIFVLLVIYFIFIEPTLNAFPAQICDCWSLSDAKKRNENLDPDSGAERTRTTFRSVECMARVVGVLPILLSHVLLAVGCVSHRSFDFHYFVVVVVMEVE